MTVVLAERSLWEMARRLREFEGYRCLWRVPVALATYAVLRALPIAAAIVVAFVTGIGNVLQAALAAFVALVVEALGKKLRARFRWNAVGTTRLGTRP